MHESGGRKAAPRLWLLQGKLAGDNAQVLALGHSLSATGFDAEPRTIGADLRQAAKRRPGRTPDITALAKSGLRAPWPDVIIACGSTPCIVAQWVKRLSGGRTVHVQLGRLAAKPERIPYVHPFSSRRLAPRRPVMVLPPRR